VETAGGDLRVTVSPGDAAHMALGTPEAIARDPSLKIANDVALTAEQSPVSHAATALIETFKSAGIEPNIVREVIDYYEQGTEHSEATLATLDATHREGAIVELRGLWGDKFEANVAAINKLLGSMPKGHAEAIRNGRRLDGRAVMNDPAILQRLFGQTRGAGASVPAGNRKETIASIEKLMRTDRAGYLRDEPLQARYRALLQSQE